MKTLVLPSQVSAPVFPDGLCANCATAAGLELAPSRLVRTTAVILPGFAAGQETSVEVLLPFCPSCRPTARRLRPTVMQLVVVWVALVFAVFTAGFGVCVALSRPIPESGAAGIALLVVSTAIEAAWYLTRKPKGAASSYYQPVRLVSAAANGWVLRFSNDTYAGATAAANAGARESA